MTTNTYELQQIQNTKKQVTLDVDSAQDWVTIKDLNDENNSVFLQGDDAAQFISQSKEMYNKNGDISLEDAYYFFAYEYLDLLIEG